MTFLKNIQFSHLIKINGQQKEFNFRKSNADMKALFTVDTLDPKGNRIIFNMQPSGDSWSIMQTELPAWILENEKAMDESIQRELNSQEVYMAIPETKNYRQFKSFFNFFG